jgi:hypothetical protein
MFYNRFYVLPENGARVPKHIGCDHLIFVLINAQHLVGIMNGVG